MRDSRWVIAGVVAGVAVMVGLLGIALGLVASPTSSQARNLIDLATSELVPGMECHGALLEGDLVTHPTWLVAVGRAEPQLIFWPRGYAGRARGEQIEIVNGAGDVVARTGDRISAGGGGSTIDGVTGFVMCPDGPTVIEPAEPPAPATTSAPHTADSRGYELHCGPVPIGECEARAAEFVADFRTDPPPPRIVPPGTEIVSITLSTDTLDATLSNGLHISAGD
jgi:hypothetical protein